MHYIITIIIAAAKRRATVIDVCLIRGALLQIFFTTQMPAFRYTATKSAFFIIDYSQKNSYNMLRIAVQSKGRLYDETMELLKEAGIKLTAVKRTLLVPSRNFPV